MSVFSDPKHAKHKLVEDMVFISVEMGFAVVQEVAAETLIQKPGLSLKEFTKILDEYLEKQRDMNKSKEL
jgi:hypothetical protein|tara:strand:- start:479 stop:688 length:210 start_codon:yes stop_codon:yes gene_type:complete